MLARMFFIYKTGRKTFNIKDIAFYIDLALFILTIYWIAEWFKYQELSEPKNKFEEEFEKVKKSTPK